MALKGKEPRGRFVKGDVRAGRPKGTPNKVTAEVREVAQSIVEDPIYREVLKQRLLMGKLAPAMESMLWHYAYGKPKERVELSTTDGLPLTLIERVIVDPKGGK